jgi:hypothetical protein
MVDGTRNFWKTVFCITGSRGITRIRDFFFRVANKSLARPGTDVTIYNKRDSFLSLLVYMLHIYSSSLQLQSPELPETSDNSDALSGQRSTSDSPPRLYQPNHYYNLSLLHYTTRIRLLGP